MGEVVRTASLPHSHPPIQSGAGVGGAGISSIWLEPAWRFGAVSQPVTSERQLERFMRTLLQLRDQVFQLSKINSSRDWASSVYIRMVRGEGAKRNAGTYGESGYNIQRSGHFLCSQRSTSSCDFIPTRGSNFAHSHGQLSIVSRTPSVPCCAASLVKIDVEMIRPISR